LKGKNLITPFPESLPPNLVIPFQEPLPLNLVIPFQEYLPPNLISGKDSGKGIIRFGGKGS
jgi:hypothetical protein